MLEDNAQNLVGLDSQIIIRNNLFLPCQTGRKNSENRSSILYIDCSKNQRFRWFLVSLLSFRVGIPRKYAYSFTVKIGSYLYNWMLETSNSLGFLDGGLDICLLYFSYPCRVKNSNVRVANDLKLLETCVLGHLVCVYWGRYKPCW